MDSANLSLAPVKKVAMGFTPGLVFGTYPQLRAIWDTELASKAEEATDDFQMTVTEDGEVFLILLGGIVIGVTGYWPIAHGMVGLRWHGLLEKFRGCGYGGKALELLCAKLQKGVTLYEVAFTKKAVSYFKTIGFELESGKDVVAKVLDSAGGGVYVLSRKTL